MALNLVGSIRDSVLLKNAVGSQSPRAWGVWQQPNSPWVTIANNEEAANLPAGRYRMEIISGRVLTYQNGDNKGTLNTGVYVLEGEISLYTRYPEETVEVVLTRLA